MMRFALTLEWNGAAYMGYQRQSHGPSVQQAVEDAVHSVTGETVAVHAAGRTDTGVHALGMRAHFDLARSFDPFRMFEALNAHLRKAKHAVAVLDCIEVAQDWHARFSCLGRAYEYRIINRRAPLTLDLGQAWRIAKPLDEHAMHEAAQLLVGLHDFTTFRSVHCQSASPVKTLDRLDVRREGDRVIVEAAARSFLHHQVRSMVGCLALVGQGQWRVAQVGDALAAKDRSKLGLNAPSEGLYFVRANYPGE
ncbi:MAG: tRNA pseudouridine(38-40) synthase TruA [Novosphingobium sp. 16-62-11]|uniref:tRNA pseudouridine(38-40) synthase TruA n=1 Tax=Novosphingobium sp. 17-62-19 TaxID=1970406 RepID=UPI000BC4E24D|nr:tRNA pseudouridine(38-40) synthase TruA [Novosphingobium sp. 17-62-19]OYX95332.1 MAG: tRNA pseudouridine(38-40) synthase TruA [Novosphingobium sp. 35-62-5]OYZ44975.1 MAG: tRNA pseudouridine(38-40) synthase TruA [Novosphingobium sp. 16-62-11]OZA20458.1 MAG: tRNA pseudouridine(38-40) synthase TruA [Novosphingobium sp. 17-62-19]HQS95541.1 tRNA pseudouridine(38-40) synthase TruA [Novosphingobium sp.]